MLKIYSLLLDPDDDLTKQIIKNSEKNILIQAKALNENKIKKCPMCCDGYCDENLIKTLGQPGWKCNLCFRQFFVFEFIDKKERI